MKLPAQHHLRKRRWRSVGRFIIVIHTGNFHRMGYLMLHHLAGAAIYVANIVNCNCTPIEDDDQSGLPDMSTDVAVS